MGWPSAEHFVLGRVLSASSIRTPTGCGCAASSSACPTGPATIVCGAPNVAAGQTVAVARPGAVMPDGTKISKAKLRGVVSEGMILAERELDRSSPPTERASWCWTSTRDSELAPGTPLQEVLPISMDVLELEITPNRPDCLGVYGVARELHAATGARSRPRRGARTPAARGAAGDGAGAQVEVHCPDLCPASPRGCSRTSTIAPSPPWMKARLSAAGSARSTMWWT